MLKVRIQFEKLGSIRFASHRDLMRAFERAFAAGGVPVSWSEGFHPHMRLSFGPPLKTGWESREEYMDVQLEAPMDGMAAACNEKLPDGLRITRVVEIGERVTKLASDISAVALEAAVESEDAIAAGAPRNGSGPDASAIRERLANQFLQTPNTEGEPRVLEADVVRTEDAIRIRYTSSMLNGRIVTPDTLVSASIGDPGQFRVPVKVARIAQYVERDGRFVSPLDEGVVHPSV